MRSETKGKRRQQWRKTAVEIALFILLSLFLSLVYNAVSPAGLRILPKRSAPEKQAFKQGIPVSQSSIVFT